MTPVKFIYFDLGNVLCYFSHELAARQVADLAGLDPQGVRQLMFASDFALEYETGRITTPEFHEAFCKTAGCEIELADFVHAASDIFRMNFAIAALLTQLRSINFPMAILSNTCVAHWDHISHRFPLFENWFDRRLLSFEVGACKPSAEIFRVAIERANVPAEQVFFTDDLLEHVESARKLGIQAVQFESVPQITRELVARGVQINL